ncbi:hypothetical protein V6N13_020873 [Hibiscus sabdariffa]
MESYVITVILEVHFQLLCLTSFTICLVSVDLPPWFSSMSIALKSSVNLDINSIEKIPRNVLPMICFRYGSLPLPDVLSSSIKVALSNRSFEGLQVLQNSELCYPVPRNLTIKLTNEQISAGALYFGIFNGVGSARTQSKMIAAYSFAANISVEGCTTSLMQGQYCNQTIEMFSCGRSGNGSVSGFNRNMVTCRNNFETSCLGDGEMKIYALEIVQIAESLTLSIQNPMLRPMNSTGNSTRVGLMCFARYGAMASATLHDYSGNLNQSPLVIHFPKVGVWYFSILAFNLSKEIGGAPSNVSNVCYSLELQELECPPAKAGPNCSSERYMLQTVLRKYSAPFESYYLPDGENMMSDAADFQLEPLLSNHSIGGLDTWTYFLLNVPRGAAGANLHVRLMSDRRINYEIYARYDGLPSLVHWDYYYVNETNSSNSMFFELYNSSDEKVDFYFLYVREGIWSIALRHLNRTGDISDGRTTMSISLERCPKRCSHHGVCKYALDASGLTSYSFCTCDRNHGGFDCSIEIVSYQGHIWRSIALIASNLAALLPSLWALHQRAFAEWVVYSSSGIASALYHACDSGTWCALSFGVLQFMDFWLSFMAVVTTFVYLTIIDEVLKRAIHAAAAIITTLMGVTKATSTSNSILVLAIGAIGLLLGWLIEFSTKYQPLPCSTSLCLNRLERWPNREWLWNIVNTVKKRYRLGFMLAGFIGLAMATLSWNLESSETYWIWHRLEFFAFFLARNAHQQKLPVNSARFFLSRCIGRGKNSRRIEVQLSMKQVLI